MEKLEANIEEVLKHEPVERHSYFQLKYFIIGKEPTIQAKLWRCVRELKARKESIDAMRQEIDQAKDNKRLAEIKKAKFSATPTPDELAKEEKSISLRMADRQITSHEKSLKKLERKLADAEDEAKFFVECFKELEEIEPIQAWDKEECQTEYWSQKFTQDINLRMLLRQPLDTELVKSILSLKDGTPVKVETEKMLYEIRNGDAITAELAKSPKAFVAG